MDAAAYQQFFLEPDDSRHRRYEALRALFVEQHSLKRVAQDYGVSYGTLSNWASEFRAQWDVGQRPPFSFRVSPKSDLCCKSVFEWGIHVGWFESFQ